MSRLNEIRRVRYDAARVLEEAGFTSDSDIRSLDRRDLQELFPGVQNLQTRRVLFDHIHGEQSAGATSRKRSEVLKEIAPDAMRILEKEGCLDYLECLDRTDLLELFPGVDKLKLRKKIFEIIHPQNSPADKIKNFIKGKLPNSKEVRYQKLDAGMSPTLSKQVIKKVTSKMRVQFTETSGDHKVSILLCPVISRIGSDAEAAIASIQDDKPVILVFLIHSLKPHSVSVLKNWDDSKNIVLYAYLFHHETKSGLLRCKENENAIADIEKKLLEYSEEIRRDQGNIAPGEGI